MTGRPGGVLLAFEGYGAEPTGAERMALRAAEQLAGRGWSVAVLSTAAQPATRAALATAGVPVVGSAAELARVRPGWTPAVVHGFDLARPEPLQEAVRVAQRFRARFVLTPCSAPQVWPDRAAAGRICAAAAVVFVISQPEARALPELGVPAGRIRLVPHAADLVGTPRPAAFRQRYGLAGPVVLYLGRRAGFKGYRTLLEATREVWARLPGTGFVFIGPDTDPAAPAAFAAHADPRVLDLGVAGEQTKHDALAACDLLCLPTTADVFPLVFIEAWLSGKPVVSGDFPGAGEVVRHGVDGLVVRSAPGPVAAALVELLADPGRRAAMGEAGRRRADREFGWSRVADAYEAGYRAEQPAPTGREAR